MIRKLQIKFVAVNMAIVAVMLCVIFGLVYHSTRVNLENESISMMKSIAHNPFQLGQPNEQSPELRLPYFTLQLGKRGELISTGGGYYDLSDREFLKELIEESAGSRTETGVIKKHNLRFCRVETPMGTVGLVQRKQYAPEPCQDLSGHRPVQRPGIFLCQRVPVPVGRPAGGGCLAAAKAVCGGRVP